MNRFSIGVAIAILAMAAPRATLAQSPASSLRTSAEARFGSPSPQPGEGSGVKGTSDRVAESKDQPKSEPEARPKFEKKLEESPTVLAGPVETRRLYRVSLGPWSRDIEVPDSIDLFDIADRIRAFVGMLMILGVAVFLSENRRAISGRVVFWGLALQWGFALLVLRVPAGIRVLARAGDGVKAVLDCALEGASFVFGKPLVDPEGPAAFVFAFRVLPTVIFVAALFAVLYHLGVMQWIVRAFAVVMAWCMGTSGAESLDVAASLFLGQTEAPLTIRPYLARLTRSELLTVMTAGMAHVSGGVMAAYMAFGIEARHILTAVIMTAPGAIMLSKLLVPETGKPETLGTVSKAEQSTDANVLDAAARGTRDGLHLALNIAAVLISFLALVALVNMGIPYIASAVHYITGWTIPNTLQGIVGWAMAPVAYMLGVPWEDCKGVGVLLGTRTVLNELIAYKDLGDLKPLLIDRSFIIASFALCGFANISSIGIQLGGIGALAPERRHDLARLGVRALFAGTLANYLSACIAGILL
jgi:CNT family concentrative nucleoside transporter